MNFKETKTPIQNFRFLEENFIDYVSKEKNFSDQWKEFLIKNSFPDKSDLSDCQNLSGENKISLIFDEVAKFYRKFGYLLADLNPLEDEKTKDEIQSKINSYLNKFNFSESDFNIKINNEKSLYFGKTFKEALNNLENKYLNKMSAEFEHLIDHEKYLWLCNHFEEKFEISKEEKEKIALDLMEIDLFEQFIHLKFQGSKRFSIEGADSSMIFFDEFLKESAKLCATNVVMGMAHRGRLNFLTKMCGESYSSILGQFAGGNYFDEEIGNSGDVKYHLGGSKVCEFSESSIEVILMPNPSHLEAVNGPVLGLTRVMQDSLTKKDDSINSKKKIIPFLIHGDASFVGQGVVYECLAMNNLDGYDVGGCVHLIIDNQIGFTANANEIRPSKYASDVAKTLNIPIFHLNGDDPEIALHLGKLCARVRNEFSGDIVVNLVCYRRFGHNEGDEPLFTQPLMYKKISEKQSIYQIYKEKLIKDGVISESTFSEKENKFNKFLHDELEKFKSKESSDLLHTHWSDHEFDFDDSKGLQISSETHLKKEFICEIIKTLKDATNHVQINQKLKKLVLDSRITALENGLLSEGEKIIDWGLGEMLAFTGVLNDGKNIRISGEDVVRGTFAHRHAAFIDSKTGEKYFYYSKIAKNNAKFSVFNSLLSEYGVMGFEFGYSTFRPDNLIIWEAQFGDFVNCAQVIIDQYLSASEQKWLKLSNLVLMLPHGYEGQGPEHSSARIERFLQLCAQFNFRVVQPTTPSNLFHILRAQVADKTIKKPLIIFTPKSLLRHRLVKSSLSEFFDGSKFKPIIFDELALNKDIIKKVILCSGKIYYDIFEKISERKDVFLIRLEALYPFPISEILSVLNKFDLKDIELIWAQDEPENMGPYSFVLKNLGSFFASNSSAVSESWRNFNVFKDLKFFGRKASASTANGSQYFHQAEQKDILENI